jgi:hypothetical protein
MGVWLVPVAELLVVEVGGSMPQFCSMRYELPHNEFAAVCEARGLSICYYLGCLWFLGAWRAYVMDCASVKLIIGPRYALTLVQVSLLEVTCQYVQSAVVSGAAVLGGSTRYTALGHG